MATAPKAPTPSRRVIAAAPAVSTTSATSPSQLSEKTDGEKISLDQPNTPDSETVTAIIPKDITLTRDDGAVVKYATGVQEIPASDAGHWFMRAHGVKVYDPAAKD